MLVKDFKEEQGYRFSQDFLDLLPEYCFDEECGSPLEFTETLTTLHCSDPRCPEKVRMRLLAISRKLGIKGIGKEKAKGFISKHGVRNPLCLFMYEPVVDGEFDYSTSMTVSESLYSQILERNSFTLSEYVRIANLPYIQSSAMHIFDGYKSLEDAYRDIEEGGVSFIQDKLGIQGTRYMSDEDDEFREMSVSIRALKIYDSLMTYKNDLFMALPFVNIIDTTSDDLVSLRACCSDEVGGGFRSKNEFYSYVNNMFAGKIHVDFVDSATKKIDFLIWAGADGVTTARETGKVRKIRGYNEKYEYNASIGAVKDGEHYIDILTGTQFIERLQSMIE